MGLVFLKFAGDKFEKRRAEIMQEYGDILAFLEKDSFYRSKNVFYLNDTSRWTYIVKNARPIRSSQKGKKILKNRGNKGRLLVRLKCQLSQILNGLYVINIG
jgi:type I restriction-modification system DNA methylase subunit